MGNKNINWINAVKGLCIIFVFLSHSASYYGVRLGWAEALFLPFYVNAFFFVSGYLLLWKQLSEPRIAESPRQYLRGSGRLLLENIVCRIMLPSVLFAALEYFPKKVIKGEGIDIASLLGETVGGMTYWFTGALAVAELFFLLLLLTRARSVWFYAVAAIVLTALGCYAAQTGFEFVQGEESFPWRWKHGMVCTAFMAAGGLYWRYEARLARWFDIGRPSTLLLLVGYAVCSIACFDYLYEGYMVAVLQVHAAGVLWGILASVLLIAACRRLPELPLLTFVGQNSIGFYFLSGALPMTFGIVCRRLPVAPNLAILMCIWVATLALAYAVVTLLNRYAPWVWDVRKLKVES